MKQGEDRTENSTDNVLYATVTNANEKLKRAVNFLTPFILFQIQLSKCNQNVKMYTLSMLQTTEALESSVSPYRALSSKTTRRR